MSEFPPPKKNAGVVYGKNIDIDRISPGLEKNCWTTNEQQISVENQDKNNLKENCDLVIGAHRNQRKFSDLFINDWLLDIFIHSLLMSVTMLEAEERRWTVPACQELTVFWAWWGEAFDRCIRKASLKS